MSNVPELKPCPFCGSAEIVYVISVPASDGRSTRAECSMCFARTRGCDDTREAALLWNRRIRDE